MAALKLPKGLVLPLTSGVMAICLALAHYFEGVRYTAYQDAKGIWTICYGHTAGVKPGQAATQAQCDAFYQADIAEANAAVHRLIHVPLTTWCEASLTDFAFHKGQGTLERGTIPAKFNSGQPAAAARTIGQYTFIGQKDCRMASSRCAGIAVRAAVEQALCEYSP